MKNLMKLAVVGLLAVGIMGCDKDDDDQAMSTVNAQMKSVPASDYQAVKVEVTEVQVHSDNTGWEVIDVPDQVVDLQLLQSNATVVLGSKKMETGNITQVRMILGDENTVLVNGISYPLSLSSQDESGLKLNITQSLEKDRTYTLVLEFDAKQSIIVTETNTYKLKPVLRAWFTS